MNLCLTNLNVIVVGGTNGIGLAIVKGFLCEGAIVHLISRSRKENVVRELENITKSSVFFYNCDVTDEQALLHICHAIMENAGQKIDIVISNVGNGSGSQLAVGEANEWTDSWNINFNSALNVTRIFSPELIKAKGSLIFISSIAGMEFVGAPTSYSTAKSALISFAKSLSHRLAPEVRVNVVSPGNIWIEGGTWDRKVQENTEKVKNMLNENVPLKRFGQPNEISDLVLFLSSERAAFITGGCFVIDGGQTISF